MNAGNPRFTLYGDVSYGGEGTEIIISVIHLSQCETEASLSPEFGSGKYFIHPSYNNNVFGNNSF